MIEKSTNQLNYVSKPVKNIPPILETLWYPTARPMRHYRKTGSNSTAINTQYTEPANCNGCTNSRRVGTIFKMIGKKDNGTSKIPCCQTKGNIINFTGNSLITSASTNVSPTYHSNYSTYLKSRGNTYDAKSMIHKIPGINYELQPDGSKLDSSHFYENTITQNPACKITIYKPSNETFSTQGSVDSSAYISRSKYNAITKNNASFIKTFGVRIPYQEDPLFFIKNNIYNCLKCPVI